MKTIDAFIQEQPNPILQQKLLEIVTWIYREYPHFESAIKWNQPMFMDHGTFILGFSVAKHHISVGLEAYDMEQLHDTIKASGYNQTKMMFRITEKDPVDYDLLRTIIDFKVRDKQDCTTFWRS